MNGITSMSRDALEALYALESNRYELFRAKNLKLDMSRGKPGCEQLNLSDALLCLPVEGSTCIDYMDARN